MDDSAPKTNLANRPARFTSHALVELKKFKLLPFFVNSAVLLDISVSGFKVEFTAETKVKPGEKFWLSVPLTPLGIYAPTKLLCQGECKWFDDKRFRIGGVFANLDTTDQQIIEQVVETLRSRGLIKPD